MPVVQPELTDTRPAAVLRLVGDGMTAREAAAKIGINRKTVERWRQRVPGFGNAYNRATQLSRDTSPEGREALDLLVQTWTPGGLVGRPTSEPERACFDPDVLDARGNEITTQAARRDETSPYTTVRPPTRDEFHAMAAALMMDDRAPERLRMTAVAALSSGLNGGPVRARPVDLEDVAGAAARERGRDPGVPAAVWEEAKERFLGPAPDPAPEVEQSGDVVEFERSTPRPS